MRPSWKLFAIAALVGLCFMRWSGKPIPDAVASPDSSNAISPYVIYIERENDGKPAFSLATALFLDRSFHAELSLDGKKLVVTGSIKPKDADEFHLSFDLVETKGADSRRVQTNRDIAVGERLLAVKGSVGIDDGGVFKEFFQSKKVQTVSYYVLIEENAEQEEFPSPSLSK